MGRPGAGGDGRLGQAALVSQVTGAGSPNRTDRWDVQGTDLGHVLEHRGQLWMVFGDTFGAGGRNWRSNAMARVSFDPGAGAARVLVIEEMVCDRRGRAKELLPSRKGRAGEVTVIPTAGVSTGDEMVLHAMSVRQWGPPGRWSANGAYLASSADGGRRWQGTATGGPAGSRRRGPGVWQGPGGWPGDSNFVQVCFVPLEQEGGDVQVVGTPAGRFGGAALATAPASSLTDPASWRYWDGAAWVDDHRAAALVVPPPVGELSLRWVPPIGRWLMLTLDEHRRAVVARLAPHLHGPWTDPRPVVSAADQPTLYAPYLLPVGGGSEVYFTLSRFDRYNVFLFRLRVG